MKSESMFRVNNFIIIQTRESIVNKVDEGKNIKRVVQTTTINSRMVASKY